MKKLKLKSNQFVLKNSVAKEKKNENIYYKNYRVETTQYTHNMN